MESSSLQELEQIPGVGKTIAQDMHNISIHSIDALKDRRIRLSFPRKRESTSCFGVPCSIFLIVIARSAATKQSQNSIVNRKCRKASCG